MFLGNFLFCFVFGVDDALEWRVVLRGSRLRCGFWLGFCSWIALCHLCFAFKTRFSARKLPLDNLCISNILLYGYEHMGSYANTRAGDGEQPEQAEQVLD